MFNISQYKSISEREDKTNAWWKENKIFERSIEERPKDDQFSFLDGPPFVTGMPHFGHLVGRIAKDVIPRYQTMKGKRVRRVWGWDCHGLPIEEKVEKKLGLKNRREVEKFGINKFLQECFNYVESVSSEWEWYVDKIGEWIDFKNAYKTMHTPYMESVIWVFKQLYEKDLVYEGVKTLLYCTRCGTPVSKFEIAMDDSYADMEDPAVTVEFPVTSEGEFKDVRILAWTTTPWTLPSNRALVVHPDEVYVQFSSKEAGKTYIAAKKRMKSLLGDDPYKVVKEFRGKDLVGLSYKAPFAYYQPNDKDWKVYAYEGMVTMDEGVGIVHSAPGFGEIDTHMGEELGLTIMFAVDDEGKFKKEVEDFAGMYVKKADKEIIKNLEERDLLFKVETITHRYPYCYRCETPLIHRAQPGWFIDVQKIKPLLKKNAKDINWVPPKLQKRFDNNLEGAPDWNISRTRYWATIMPVWKCENCGEQEIFGSIKEIEDRSGETVKNLHRDGVDHITFDCGKCKGGTMKRIPEVLDVWVESGSMPYGQIHYPFENEALFGETFPGDYIVEYVGQIRAWFYVMHVISNALQEQNSFKNVVVTGTLAGTDGRKMSKMYGNYPDPKETLEKLGGDAIRLYMMGSSIMLGEDPSLSEEEMKNQVTQVIFPLWNSVKYFVTYANLAEWKPDFAQASSGKPENRNAKPVTSNVLDQWILARLRQFGNEMDQHLSTYYMPQAARLVAPFVSDLSTWYIRRSRDRFVNHDQEALATLYHVLAEVAKIIAPLAPFLAEEMHQVLVKDQFPKEPDSVHLCMFPKTADVAEEELELIAKMEDVRTVASLGQAARIESGMKIRQPLQMLRVKSQNLKLEEWVIEILRDELNVKEVEQVETVKEEDGWSVQKVRGNAISLNTKLTDELKQEGLMRELVRMIQAQRKKEGLRPEDVAEIVIGTDDEDVTAVVEKFNEEIKDQTRSSKVVVEKESAGVTVTVNGISVTIGIES